MATLTEQSAGSSAQRSALKKGLFELARDPLTMSAAGPRAALALKTQSALMSGDMGIAPTVAGGQAQRAAAAAQATATGSAGDAYDLRALANASDSLAVAPASRAAGRPAAPAHPFFAGAAARSFPTGVPRRATSGRREPENRAPTVHPDARRARRPRAIFSDFALRFCIGILYQF